MRRIRAPLFVFSHMRSYSSLLSHVLGSHPDIDGYCETHLRYNFPFDVLRLQWRVRKLTGEPLRGRYVLDKILHNFTISPSILESRRLRAVVMLRHPADALQSILHMGTHLDPLAQNTNLEHVTDYYVARLERLTELARKVGSRAAFVESDALLERPDETLQFLQEHLQLSEPLEKRYRSFAKTGKPKFGDPSPAIHTGEIGARKPRRVTFVIPTAVLVKVKVAHAACLEACHRHCATMPSSSRELDMHLSA